jgi:hypothetical protein
VTTVQVQEKAPLEFSSFALPYLQFCLTLVLQTVPSAPPGSLPDQLVVRCMAVVRLVIELQGP